MKNFLMVAFALLLPLPVFADGHPPGTIRGEGVELSELQHTMAGTMHGHPMYASFSERTFSARLIVRSHETDVVLDIADTAAGVYRGEMSQTVDVNGAEQVLATSVEYIRIERTDAMEKIRIHMLVNGQPAVATVTGESFANGHFQAPEFSVEGVDAAPFVFKFTGEACFGYSVNLAMLVTAAHAHLSVAH